MAGIDRVGLGYDLHRLTPKRRLILAGVDVPYEEGLAGHSDADVVIHAIIDGLLGAAALGDIGEQFPDTDEAYKNVDSGLLLERVMKKIYAKGYRPVNIDVTIIAEKPKLLKYKPAMRQNLARIMGMDDYDVSVKAKTNEGLGAVGEAKAIACYAIVSLRII